MAEKPKRITKKKLDEAFKMVDSAYKLSDKLVEFIRKNPDSREACLLVMAIELWKQAVTSRKVDAVAMGIYGMQHFFEQAPEDCGRVRMRLAVNKNGDMGIIIEPNNDDPPDSKTELR